MSEPVVIGLAIQACWFCEECQVASVWGSEILAEDDAMEHARNAHPGRSVDTPDIDWPEELP